MKSLFPLLFLFVVASYGQQNNYAKLYKAHMDSLIATTKHNEAKKRIAAYLDLSARLTKTDSALAMHYINQGIVLAKSKGYEEEQLALQLNKAAVFIESSFDEQTMAVGLINNTLAAATSKGFQQIEIKSLNLLGKAYKKQSDYLKALSYYNKSLRISQKEEAKKWVAKNLNDIGDLKCKQYNFDDGTGYLNRSLKINKEIGNERGIAENLYYLARSKDNSGNYESSLNYLKKALNLAIKFRDFDLIADVMINMGFTYHDLGNNTKAIYYLTKSEKLNRLTGNRYQLAGNLLDKGFLLQGLGKPKAARENYIKSLAIYKDLGDVRGELEVLNNLGVICEKNNNYSGAIAYYKKGLQIFSDLEDQKGMAMSLYNLAVVYEAQGRDSLALSYLTKSIQICEKLRISEGIILNANTIGNIYKEQGDYKKAYAFYDKSLKLSNEKGDRENMVIAKFNIAGIYFLEQKEDAAIKLVNELIIICREMQYNSLLRSIYKEAGVWYISQGKLPKAVDFYYEALQLTEKLNDTLGIAEINASIAEVHKNQKDFSKALIFYNKALNYFQLSNNKSGIAGIQNSISDLLLKKGNFEKAINYASQALNNFKILQDSCAMAISFLTMGSSYNRLQKTDSAFYFLKKGKNQALICNENLTISNVFLELGKTHQLNKEDTAALRAYKEALFYAEKSQNREMIKNAAEILYPLYQNNKQYKKAFETLHVYQANKDSLFNKANTRALVQKEMEYLHDKELQEKALLQQKKEIELQKQKWINYTSIGACIALFIIVLAVYRNYRNKYKANKLLRSRNSEIIRQKRELEALDHAKSQFFANISHELRTPLTLISSPIQRLLSHNEVQLPGVVKETLQLAERNVKQLRGLVDDILDLSKLESGKLELKEEEAALRPLLNRIFSNFDYLADHLGVRYTSNLQELPEVTVITDTAKLEKIIINLLSNAIKHTPSGGSVELDANIKQGQLVIEVKDSGHGVSKKDLPHIFKRFYQSKQPDAPIQGGTGIGLALAKELCQVMGGSVSVSSEPGTGSIFTVKLPYRPVEHPTKAVAQEVALKKPISISLVNDASLAAKNKTATVLIVEDHPDMQQFINSLLLPQYHTLLAHNGLEALKLLKTKSVDLILSDVMMPEMDGYTLLQQLKNNDDYRSIPVVMLTALENEVHKMRALTLGVDDYLTKPFSPRELLARVHNLLERSSARIRWQEEQKSLFQAENTSLNENIEKEAELDIAVENSDLAWLKEVEKAIEKELENENFRLSTLAGQFFLSERQFQRKIKKITGLSPKKYQQEIALQKARAYLEGGNYGSVKAVAYSIGMQQPYRFSKLYELRFGKKPGEYFNDISFVAST
jgi:signal transduction histidine kinase/DNA-binding response OmpR family regulator